MKQKLAIACLRSGSTLLLSQRLEAQSPKSMALVGSWQLTFTPQGATFTSDGSVVETDGTEVIPLMNPATPAVYGTPGHGIWQPSPASGRFFVQFVSLIVNQNARLRAKKTVTITGGGLGWQHL